LNVVCFFFQLGWFLFCDASSYLLRRETIEMCSFLFAGRSSSYYNIIT